MKHDPNLLQKSSVLNSEQLLTEVSDERSLQIKNFVESRMEAGRKSELHGWVMSTILDDVNHQFGRYGVREARRYLLEDVCKLFV